MRTTKAERDLIEHLRKLKNEGYSLLSIVKTSEMYKEARKEYKEWSGEDISEKDNAVIRHYYNMIDLKRFIMKI